MRLIRLILFIFCLVFVLGAHKVFADDPLRKLGRGVVNTASGWLEVPAEIFREADRSSGAGSLFAAPFKGLFKAVGRTITGVYEIVTFPIPLPSRYRPVVEPEFIF